LLGGIRTACTRRATKSARAPRTPWCWTSPNETAVAAALAATGALDHIVAAAAGSVRGLLVELQTGKARALFENLNDIRRRQSSDEKRWAERMERIGLEPRGLEKGLSASFEEAKQAAETTLMKLLQRSPLMSDCHYLRESGTLRDAAAANSVLRLT
jgi:hypothetical protein